jgi:hypothetical protein
MFCATHLPRYIERYIDLVNNLPIHQPRANFRHLIHVHLLNDLVRAPYFAKFIQSRRQRVARGTAFLETFAHALKLNAPFVDAKWKQLKSISPRPQAHNPNLSIVGTITDSWIAVMFMALCFSIGRKIQPSTLIPGTPRIDLIRQVKTWRKEYATWMSAKDFSEQDDRAERVLAMLEDRVGDMEKHAHKMISKGWSECDWEGCNQVFNLKVCSR